MGNYVVLRRATSATAKGAAAPSGDAVVSVEDLTDRDATTAAADPAVSAVAPVMPTSLITPVAVGTALGKDDGWAFRAVGADACRCDGRGVTVAVLDTGIDRTHPAFAGVDIVERDFTGEGPADGNGHGTHCAGTIFGRDVSGRRIGIARGVRRALVGKVLPTSGKGGSGMVFEAMVWAAQQGANVVSMSLGFDFPQMVARLVRDGWPQDIAVSSALVAYRDNLRMFDALMSMFSASSPFGTGPLVVAAAGNESRRLDDPRYRVAASLPAAADGVISVAAIDAGLAVAGFSNSHALVSAPGVDIVSAWPGGGLESSSGTSMACPHVAGIAALWWQAVRAGGTTPTADLVRARLLASASRDAMPGADEADIGLGLVKAPA